MLRTTQMVIFYGHKIKKISFENLNFGGAQGGRLHTQRQVAIFEVSRVKNCNSRLCTNPLGSAHHTEEMGETNIYYVKHASHRLDGPFVWSGYLKK